MKRAATYDLFAEPAAISAESAPAAVAVPCAPKPPLASAAVQAGPLPRPKQLWYAAVFAGLPKDHTLANLQRLSLHAQRFTSQVSIESPDALLLEIKGSVKLFGSLDGLHADIDAVWNRLALRSSSATAPTPLAALWMARAGKCLRMENAGGLAGVLAELPVDCTSWHPAWLQTLRSMGVTRLGELLRLPRAGVARRLSPAAVMDLDAALGRQAAPRRTFVARERFRERCDFETEIETVGYLQKAVEPLIERCARFLRERQAGVQEMQIRLRHRVLPATRVPLGLASITSERRRLAAVVDEKLHRLELPAPVRSLELLSGALLPLSAASLDAFAGGRAGRDTLPQLVERLRARLGDAAVYGVTQVPEHRPEAAWQRVSALGNVHAPASFHHDMPRPVWLLAEPLMLHAADVRRDVLDLEEGPERIESGWWDGNGVARDYYIARRHGARWWVFQERQTRCWYLHGVFA